VQSDWEEMTKVIVNLAICLSKLLLDLACCRGSESRLRTGETPLSQRVFG